MKQQLTKEEIQFIDNYLKNSGVEYIDTRAEVVDHVASEIEIRLEEDKSSAFYDEFKVYMGENKKALIKGVSKIKKKVFFNMLKKILKELFNPFALLSIPVSWLIINLFEPIFNEQQFLFASCLYVLSAMLSLGVMVYYTKGKLRNKYLYINKIVLIGSNLNMLLYYMLYLMPVKYFFILTIFFTWFNLAYVMALINYYKYYQKQKLMA